MICNWTSICWVTIKYWISNVNRFQQINFSLASKLEWGWCRSMKKQTQITTFIHSFSYLLIIKRSARVERVKKIYKSTFLYCYIVVCLESNQWNPTKNWTTYESDKFGVACNPTAAGPISINSGVTVTINSEEVLTIVLIMKAEIEKQILEWQQEIIKQNTHVMKLEGGIQAYQLLLQKMNEEEEKTGTIDLEVKNQKK